MSLLLVEHCSLIWFFFTTALMYECPTLHNVLRSWYVATTSVEVDHESFVTDRTRNAAVVALNRPLQLFETLLTVKCSPFLFLTRCLWLLIAFIAKALRAFGHWISLIGLFAFRGVQSASTTDSLLWICQLNSRHQMTHLIDWLERFWF